MLDPVRGPSKARGEIKALTSLRGLAAMAVVMQHFSATAQLHASGWIPSLVPHGYMAVDFFFVLSGFIMGYTYLAGFEARGMAAYGPFLWKRVARIVPLGIAVTAVILVCGALASLDGLGWLFLRVKASGGIGAMIAVNVLHLQGFLPDYNLNDPSWSVSVELGAYLLFPGLIFLMFKAPAWVTAACVAVAVGVLLRISQLDTAGGLAYRSPALDFGRCVAEFCFGLLVYRAYASRTWLHVLAQDRWAWCLAGLTAVALVARNDLLAAAVFPFLVLAFALNKGVPSRLLSHSWPYYLGTISFSIYLVHNMFRTPEFWLLRIVHPAPLESMTALLAALLGSLSVLPFAALAYHAVERPGRDALNNAVRRMQPRVALPATSTRPAD